jgi:predicted transcriptional regulator of viral defense system
MASCHNFGMTRRWVAELMAVAVEQHGLVSTRDVQSLGGGDTVLVDLARRGHIERLERGVYRFAALPSDQHQELMAAVLSAPKGAAISHSSALALWELCDVSPATIEVTVPIADRVRRTLDQRVVIYRRDLVADDFMMVDGVPVVSPFQAIRDGMESHLDARLIGQAITTATERGLLSRSERDELTAVHGAPA